MDAFTDTLVRLLEASVWLAPLAAFLGGVLTAANPCVLASVPALMACVAGGVAKPSTTRAFLLSLTFSAGLSIMFLTLFLATWGASSLLKATWWEEVAAAVCLLMGLQLVGWLRLPLPGLNLAGPPARGFASALALGLVFGLVSLPCAGPLLVALLALVPVKGAFVGGVLLAAYSLGHCALILVGGTSVGAVRRILDARGLIQGAQILRRVAGGVLVLVGVGLLFG